MTLYYFLIAALPPLVFKSPPEMTFKELCEFVPLNLTSRDALLFRKILEPVDLYNIKALWLGAPLNEFGTMSAKELEEAILIRDCLPLYVIEFLDEYESNEERLRFFSSLYTSMYRQEEIGVVGKYYALEREMRLVLSALRAKKTGRDIGEQLQFEDFQDPLVMQILSQKDASDYSPPEEYEGLKNIFIENSDPKKLSEALFKYRFDRLGEWEENELFTLDRFIAYAARLLILESFLQLDQEKGKIALEELNRYG